MTNKKRLEATVHGLVQGVFFRDSTRRFAQARQIKGWVRNGSDGTVQVVAEGSEQALRELSGFLQRGPSGARVARVDEAWQSATEEFTTFRIQH